MHGIPIPYEDRFSITDDREKSHLFRFYESLITNLVEQETCIKTLASSFLVHCKLQNPHRKFTMKTFFANLFFLVALLVAPLTEVSTFWTVETGSDVVIFRSPHSYYYVIQAALVRGAEGRKVC